MVPLNMFCSVLQILGFVLVVAIRPRWWDMYWVGDHQLIMAAIALGGLAGVVRLVTPSARKNPLLSLVGATAGGALFLIFGLPLIK